MKWTEVCKRIDRLIASGTYITQKDIDERIRHAKWELKYRGNTTEYDKRVLEEAKRILAEYGISPDEPEQAAAEASPRAKLLSMVDGAAYYLLPAGLNQSALSDIEQRAKQYIIAAPFAHLSDSQMDEYHITFLKIGRDIDEKTLENTEHAVEIMAQCAEKMQTLQPISQKKAELMWEAAFPVFLNGERLLDYNDCTENEKEFLSRDLHDSRNQIEASVYEIEQFDAHMRLIIGAQETPPMETLHQKNTEKIKAAFAQMREQFPSLTAKQDQFFTRLESFAIKEQITENLIETAFEKGTAFRSNYGNIKNLSKHVFFGRMKRFSDALENALQTDKTDSSIHFGLLGNGITVYDTARYDHEANDYLTIAHISEEGNITYYTEDISD